MIFKISHFKTNSSVLLKHIIKSHTNNVNKIIFYSEFKLGFPQKKKRTRNKCVSVYFHNFQDNMVRNIWEFGNPLQNSNIYDQFSS